MTVAHCPTCGAKMVEYKHHLTRPLVEGAAALALAGGGPINLADLNLSRSVWDNFQKLRYWKLVQPHQVGGVRSRGEWYLTVRGWAFLRGELALRRYAWTYRGDIRRYEGPKMLVWQIAEGHLEHGVWVRERRAV